MVGSNIVVKENELGTTCYAYTRSSLGFSRNKFTYNVSAFIFKLINIDCVYKWNIYVKNSFNIGNNIAEYSKPQSHYNAPFLSQIVYKLAFDNYI